MAELRVSPEAANDLLEIRHYIAVQQGEPAASEKLISRIMKSRQTSPKVARLYPPH